MEAVGPEGQLLEFKALLKIVVDLRLASPNGVSGDRATEGEREALDALKGCVKGSPALMKLLLSDDSWCSEDDDRLLHLHVGVRKYVDFTLRSTRLDNGGSAGPDRSFDDAWTAIMTHLSRETVEWNFTAPLENIILSDGRTVQLTPAIALRPLAANQGDPEQSGSASRRHKTPKCELHLTTRSQRRIVLAPAAAMAAVLEVLAALRLFSGRGIWAKSISAHSDSVLDPGGLTWRPFEWTEDRSDPHARSSRSWLRIDPAHDHVISRIVRTLRHQLQQDVALEKSVASYNAAFEQSNHSAALLRVWGAVEALLVPKGSRHIARTAADKLVAGLALEDRTRESLRNELLSSYRVRSRIVHGDNTDEHHILPALSIAAEAYRRSVIQRITYGWPEADLAIVDGAKVTLEE